MTKTTKADFARRMGVNKSTVTRWAQAGRLVLDAAGRVLVEESQARIAQTQAGREDVADRHARNRGATVPATAAKGTHDVDTDAGAGEPLDGEESLDSEGEAPADDADSASALRTQYKAQAMEASNKRVKLELAVRHGQRLRRESVQREAQGLGNALRAALERLVDVAAPQIAHRDTEGRRELLHAEARALRRILNTELARSQRRIRKEATHA